MNATEIILLLAIGFLSGAFGGLLGIGGSVILIPAATILIRPDQQVYQAAAMILNVFVAGTATIKHARKGVLDMAIIKRMVPFATVFVVLGVMASNHISGGVLLRSFGVLVWIIALSEFRLLIWGHEKKNGDLPDAPSPRMSLPLLGGIGTIMGFLGGLLGIGGGVIAVPLLQYITRFPLRMAIATAACVTFPMALVGAIYKNATLHQLSQDGVALSAWDSLSIAAAVVPTAIIGSWFGATILHRLPIPAIRLAFAALLVFAGFRMTGVLS
ncbi:MAG: sulfite exporter TauE/SafE family protein [Phycisphaerales bacterium]|nr:sulfite exporter TauE/SafE family protein [Phycisphaerales bacterium]